MTTVAVATVSLLLLMRVLKVVVARHCRMVDVHGCRGGGRGGERRRRRQVGKLRCPSRVLVGMGGVSLVLFIVVVQQPVVVGGVEGGWQAAASRL